MNRTLQEVLKERAAQYPDPKPIIDEWQGTVARMLDQLKTWLQAADPDGYVQRDRGQTQVTEPSLGRYKASRLDLHSFGKWVGILPKARNTVGRASPQRNAAPERATGRIDITDELRRYILYRFGLGAEERWVIEDVAGNREMEPLTPARFEAAILSYFL